MKLQGTSAEGSPSPPMGTNVSPGPQLAGTDSEAEVCPPAELSSTPGSLLGHADPSPSGYHGVAVADTSVSRCITSPGTPCPAGQAPGLWLRATCSTQEWLGAPNTPLTKLLPVSWHAAYSGNDSWAGHCTCPQLTPWDTQGGLRSQRGFAVSNHWSLSLCVT